MGQKRPFPNPSSKSEVICGAKSTCGAVEAEIPFSLMDAVYAVVGAGAGV